MGNITNSIARGEDVVSRLESLLSDKKQFIIKQAMNVFLLLIILFVFGCLDFATLKFQFEKIFEISFWGAIITKVIAGVAAFNLGINFMYEAELKRAKGLEQAMNDYDTLNSAKRNDFEHFIIKIYNPAEKKAAYKSKISKEIYRLNKHSKRKDRLLYSSDLPERQAEKLKNKYCIKRKELEELKTDEYIDKNLSNIIIKYNEVDPSIFELDINGSSTYKGQSLTGNETYGRVKASSTVILGMIVCAMFTTAVGLELSKEVFESEMEALAHYALKILEDAGVILWQVLRGFGQPRKIISNELTKPYTNRVKVLKQYWIWHTKQATEDDAAYKKLHEEEIEISEDVLKQAQQIVENGKTIA